MFTGLIKEIGRIRALTPRHGVVRVDVDAPRTAGAASVGDSIALNGICLTVTAVKGRVFSVEAATETQRLSTLSGWRRGDPVHIEPALRAGDPLDGHLVQGHIDGTGTISAIRKSGGSVLLTVQLADHMARFLTPKGSVAVDGVSLTVDEGPFHTGCFTVNLIPLTLQWTTFGKARVGRLVNLEMDVLVKAARGAAAWGDVPALDRSPGGTTSPESPEGWTLDRLRAKGFGSRRTGRTGKGRS